MKIINVTRVVEVAGRLQARGRSFLNSAKQVKNADVQDALAKAGNELLDFSVMLAEAFDTPKEALTSREYRKAVRRSNGKFNE